MSGCKVLLVEDEGILTIFVEDLLTDLGHEVVAVAQNLDDAMTQADQAKFDVALLDLNLNGAYSYPVAELLAAKGVPFAFVTGYGLAGVAAGFGEVPTLRKPFDVAHLASLMDRLARSRSPA